MRIPYHGSRTSNNALSTAQIVLGLFGLLAPVLTFFLAVSDLSDTLKFVVLVALASGYASVCLWSFKRSREASTTPETSHESTLEENLDAISDAAEFFGASLKPSDLFRLVSSRVAQIVPVSGSALFVESPVGHALEITQASGYNADELLKLSVGLDSGLAAMAWISEEVEVDADLALESAAISADALTGVVSAAAVPLIHDGRVFAVLVLYSDKSFDAIPDCHSTLDAIGSRLAPLLISSMSFERTTSNALTDKVTSLPNERAFFMVLENQLAESLRHRDERPLSILTIDIKNFAEVNQSYGFAAGDRMLVFAAEHLTSQLRKMDFLARSSNDEFLLVLPTASEKFATEIMDRISNHFAGKTFAISETEELKVWLNFGWATFWRDGETADQLLRTARVRKQQAKAEEPSKVLWFPKEYVN
ncbi:MAG TPA: sensor domain-containing diguanylate cyclase [Pyrinomonadaceae bacterium]|nr:sensor domain-containing diguanylate cyclase [Pyrinomonadaceae bacterium]